MTKEGTSVLCGMLLMLQGNRHVSSRRESPWQEQLPTTSAPAQPRWYKGAGGALQGPRGQWYRVRAGAPGCFRSLKTLGALTGRGQAPGFPKVLLPPEVLPVTSLIPPMKKFILADKLS